MHYIFNSYTTRLGVLQDITAQGNKVTEYYVMSCSTPVTSSHTFTNMASHLVCNLYSIWAVANLYSMQLAIEGNNSSSVHILLNLIYSMQGILESVNLVIIYSDIVYIYLQYQHHKYTRGDLETQVQ